MECPPAPYFQPDTPEGETTWDPDVDQPLYSEIATYTCPEGFVFEIYQDFPNITINFGLIEEETDTVNLTCEAFADWSPNEVPPCIRMYFSILHVKITHNIICTYIFLAKNCTDEPFEAPGADKGISDWDGVSMSYETVIKYECPKKGWGYPTTGFSEIYSYCQADKTWNLTSVEECICKFLKPTNLYYFLVLKARQYFWLETGLMISFYLNLIIFCLLVLPCPKRPPPKPEGGWFRYGLQESRYKCPNGLEFHNEITDQRFYPYWYSNCTVAKIWDPPETQKCVRKYKINCKPTLYKTSLKNSLPLNRR